MNSMHSMMNRVSGNAVLSAMALILAALIVFQASRPWSLAEARADVVGQASSLTALTFTASPQDVLLVLDGRSEELMAYRVENQNSVELFARYSVPRMFADARNRAIGGAAPRQPTR
jgi:hypothetical protein